MRLGRKKSKYVLCSELCSLGLMEVLRSPVGVGGDKCGGDLDKVWPIRFSPCFNQIRSTFIFVFSI